MSMISLVSGYLGGKPIPFMVFSNVILGFILAGLYRLNFHWNWEIWIFIALNLLSLWALLYFVVCQRLRGVQQVAGVCLVLASDSYFLINLSFTTIAAFAALSGISMIVLGSLRSLPGGRRFLIFGGLLVLAASLIRIESTALVFLVIIPAGVVVAKWFRTRRLLLGLAATGLLVLLGAAFDNLYVRSHPDWSAYYQYNETRSLLQDTPRDHLENIGSVFRNVGWNGNDYRMFVDWFFPDPTVFSISNLQYLVDHVPAHEKNLLSAGLSYFTPTPIFNQLDSVPYFLIIALAWVGVVLQPSLRRAILPLSVNVLTFLLLILYLIWSEKVPLHVWYAFLVTVALFQIGILTDPGRASAAAIPTLESRQRFGSVISALLILLIVSIALYQAARTTNDNIQKQAAYQKILDDLQTQSADETLQPDALILSRSAGIPLEWSNPLALEFPPTQYLELGWLTFSPAYHTVLEQHGIQSVP